MEENLKLKSFEDSEGQEHEIVFECEINGRKFVITTNKKIFEKNENSYRECTSEDKETEFLTKYTAPAKSLDIELPEDR